MEKSSEDLEIPLIEDESPRLYYWNRLVKYYNGSFTSNLACIYANEGFSQTLYIVVLQSILKNTYKFNVNSN